MKKMLMLTLILITVVVNAEVVPVLVTNSKYRKIDKTSKDALEWGIKGVGVGNIIFSSHELPKGEEDKYQDVRDTFYYKVDNEIHCRVYYPGTLGSLRKVIESQNPNYKFIKRWSMLWIYGNKYDRQVKMSFDPSSENEVADWDQQRFDLLPYVGGEDQDFNEIDLSKALDGREPGTYLVIISVFYKYQTGTKLVKTYEDGKEVIREEPTYKDFMLATGEFKYIKKQ